MKFELKTENENYSKSFSYLFGTFLIFSTIIILCDLALKLGMISRNYEIEYNCKLLTAEKSKTHFKKLSNLSNLKSRQQIWEFCMEFIK